MTNISNIAQQLKAAASKLLGEIKTIDDELDALNQQRDVITSGHVSKEDFLNYLSLHFKIKAATFQSRLLREMEPKVKYDFGSLERGYVTNSSFLGIYFLTGGFAPVPITEEAIYFYFGDILLEKIGEALDDKFDGEAMPVHECRKAIQDIEKTERELLQRRSELVKTIDEAGITR